MSLPKLASIYPWVSPPFIVGAPMRVMAGPALAVAVTRAGGLGFIGPSIKTKDMVADLEEATTLVHASPSIPSLPSSSLPVGVSFQLWGDDLQIASAAIKQFQPCAAWLFAPRHGQTDIDTWTRRIRDVAPRTQIWVQVGTLLEVQSLTQSVERPDVIVIQGSEAGGHGRATDGMGLMTLLPEVADLVASSGIPLFAAGGIVDGRGAAAALCLGAVGVAIGTRFLASMEARISAGYQQEVVRANNGAVSTTRTLLYNHLRGTYGWPEGYSPRTIINRSFEEHQKGRPFEELKELHDRALQDGDAGWGPQGRLATYAGAGVGLIHEVQDAADIVRDIREGVQRLVR
ncbi:hypothetical protein EYZ11_004176 [Aspergillus tanneri]|uniref:Uncharacterized protein n=1 Tax=Aspergillus tanneri TaxID=1220188 RepID=A0A4S3JS45_9EURO|nr:uncharacterized protein ATNIH1004_000956 [Aspergillus tanneri]KAA8652055.1 hypothetical protein ATNIH1004_000956 [Aspergillus tanneri]THC96361.1 hypothetical protein EYZ11_004176 [Aspergillus tanneri]